MATTYELTVIVPSLNVRTNAKYIANGSNIKTTIKKGKTYTATKEQNGWYYIKSIDGWIHSTSWGEKTVTIKKVDPPKTTTTKAEEPAVKSTIKDDYKVIEKAAARKGIADEIVTSQVNVDRSNSATLADLKTSNNASKYMEDTHHNIIFKNGKNEFGRAEKYIKSITGTKDLNSVTNSLGIMPKSFSGDYEDFDEAFTAVRYNHNIFEQGDRMKVFTHFNRFKIPMADYYQPRMIPYVFFTKPPLNMINSDGTIRTTYTDEFGNTKKTNHDDQFLAFLYNDQPKLFHSLDAAYGGDKHKFNTLLSNAVTSFPMPDEVLKTSEHGETYTGWKTVYGRHTNESNTAGQLSLSFVDNWNNDIFKMHKIWLEYINKVYRGEFYPGKANIWKKILNYTCAIYYIVCAADGETILFWSKFFGAFPINTPASSMSFTHGSPETMPEFSITYMYALKEDMNPFTIAEFNASSWGGNVFRPIYDPYNQGVTHTMAGAPFIDSVTMKEDGFTKKKLKLRFRN